MPNVRLVARACAWGIVFCLAWLAGCEQGDVGAPCNHGSVDPPSTKLVTFPALSCDELLCVYGEEQTIPPNSCNDDAECNQVGGERIFACELPAEGGAGHCTLSLDYVLERSMCSKRCSSDADCQNAGTGQKPIAKDTACRTGFSCARIQPLGEFCCEKLCVCNDELPDTSDLDRACERGDAPGCESADAG
jgi:hypothetical protein